MKHEFVLSQKTNWLSLGLVLLLPCLNAAAAAATGGTVTDADGYRTHTFTNNGTFSVTVGGTVEVLVVGGGGGSGGGSSGGGGGGGACGVPVLRVVLHVVSVCSLFHRPGGGRQTRREIRQPRRDHGTPTTAPR